MSCSLCALSDYYKAPEPGQNYHLYTIGGVFVVTAVLLVLGILITYKVTKWSTKKKLQKPSSPSADESPDSLTVH